MPPRRLIFVCAGNTCRSPLAEVLARSVFAERGLDIEVGSAGLTASGGTAAPDAQVVAARLGLDLSRHRARPVEAASTGPPALWLTMEVGQAERVRSKLGPDAEVEPLLRFARRVGIPLPAEDDVPDPVGQGVDAYTAVARTLETAVRAIADAWQQAPADSRPAPARSKTIALPRLGGLQPTLESTVIKLLEEAGELAERIGKYRALSGERRGEPARDVRDVMEGIGSELLDVAQTAITMMFVLEEQHGLGVANLLEEHVRKLAMKGYLEPHPD